MPQGSAPDGPTVLYVGGYGRSGSTVLDRVLGALPDAVSVGEIRSIWGGGAPRGPALRVRSAVLGVSLLDRGGRAGVRRLGLSRGGARASGARSRRPAPASAPVAVGQGVGHVRSGGGRVHAGAQGSLSGGRGDRRRPCGGGCQQVPRLRGDPAQGAGRRPPSRPSDPRRQGRGLLMVEGRGRQARRRR